MINLAKGTLINSSADNLKKRVVNHKARDIDMWYWSVDARPKKTKAPNVKCQDNYHKTTPDKLHCSSKNIFNGL